MYLGKKLAEGEAVDVPDFIPADIESISAQTLAEMDKTLRMSVPEETYIPVFED